MDKIIKLVDLILVKAITSLESGKITTVDSLLAVSEIAKNCKKALEMYNKNAIDSNKGEML